MTVAASQNEDGLPKGVTIVVRGRFSVLDADGQDVTPKNRKERALIALLAMSPDKRRSRAWLASMLWSERAPEQASSSLRTALKNISKRLAHMPPALGKSRLEIWLQPNTIIDDRPHLEGKAELLEVIDAPDPAFEEWLRDLRQAEAPASPDPPPTNGHSPPLTPSPRMGGTVVVITRANKTFEGHGAFLDLMLIDTLSARLQMEGADTIYADSDPDPDQIAKAETILYLDLTSAVDHECWTVHLRALANADRQFLWSGRLKLFLDLRQITDGVEIEAFASRALSQILMRAASFRMADRSALIVMQRAAARLYSGNPEQVERAETALASVTSGEAMAVALAWRGFAGLARRLEFGESSDDVLSSAQQLTEEAILRQPGNALVAGLAARVSLDVTRDIDKAAFLAQTALNAGEDNPYALNAASRVALMKGKINDAYALARRARHAADGLPHIFAWDIEVCLSALRAGDLAGAHKAARAIHFANPSYRVGLRYLLALDLLRGDHAAARRSEDMLRKVEPGFEISHFQDPAYPMLTLRQSGYDEELRQSHS